MNKKKTLIAVIIAAVVLVGVMLLLLFLPKGDGDREAATIDEGAKVDISTDKEGVHQVKVETNEKGEVDNNSYGTLMEYVPAQIKSIHIENTKGTFDVLSNTPDGEATEYTLKGYEGFDLQVGVPDQIANAAASLSFTRIASPSGENKADFGLDKPRAQVMVTYTDSTKAVIAVGNDAPQGAGTYVQFGSEDTIYLCDTDTVSAFDFGITDLISLTINDSADTTDNSQASSIKISGSGFDKEIELVPNTSEKNSASYRMKTPVECYANENESSLIDGGIRGLYANSVKMVNPSSAQLSELGLSSPYAKVSAVYPDTTVELFGSKPDSEGNIYLMVKGGKVVYQISSEKTPWVTTSYEKLVSEYALYPKMSSLIGVSVKTDATYDFSLTTKTSTRTDDEGEEITTTTTSVFYGDKEIQLGDFSAFYDDLTLIKLADANTESANGNAVLTVTYTYDDASSDKVEFYAVSNDRYLAVINGKALGHSYKADVTRASNSVKELVK